MLLQVEDEDVTLDDLWKLDLAKLDGWHCIRENTQGEEIFKQHLEAAGASGSGKLSAAEENDSESDSDDDDSSD